jgi:ABC-type lipoprotein export system ATPase subunit
VNRPSILLADEPTGNLDSRTSVEILELLQNLNDKGLTIVLVTHEHDIAQFSKRLLVFRDGKIRKDARCLVRADLATRRCGEQKPSAANLTITSGKLHLVRPAAAPTL